MEKVIFFAFSLVIGLLGTTFFFKNVYITKDNTLGNRGLIFSKMNQYEKALIDFDMAIKLNPQNPNNYLNRAFSYYKLGLIDKAKQDVQTIEKMGVAVDPSFRTLLQHR